MFPPWFENGSTYIATQNESSASKLSPQILTLTKSQNRGPQAQPEDEQLHVLPHYRPAYTDEHGSSEGQREKTQTGSLQFLNRYGFDRLFVYIPSTVV